MAIPFLLVGGAVAAAIGGIGHISAADDNEKAKQISREAQILYDREKDALEQAKKRAEKTLESLGNSKKNILETSIHSFLESYEKIKDVKVEESSGLNEISYFTITPQDVIQLMEMSNIYKSAVTSGVAGAATGVAIALAANGSLALVGTLASFAGTFLEIGGLSAVGSAAGAVGSALSFGASMTPLSAVVAPVVLFTGLSASLKADENLEKARAMRAEADAAIEKMKVSKTLCEGIANRSEMFDNLLLELNEMFSECVRLQDEIISKKENLYYGEKLNSNYFTQNEINLIAVTRSLAGAVKAVIDTPILKEDGTLADGAQKIYNQIANSISEQERTVEAAQRANGNTSYISQKAKINNSYNMSEYRNYARGTKEYTQKLIELADTFNQQVNAYKKNKEEYNELVKELAQYIGELKKNEMGNWDELQNLKWRYQKLCIQKLL